jgi:hypothetical protein
MRKIFFIIVMIVLTVPENSLLCGQAENKTNSYEWVIVGAGFAGITALAVLIDAGIKASTIAWIDPEFNVGNVGKYYREVPGNVQTQHLIDYVQNCPFFKDINSPSLDALYTYELEKFQQLHVIVDPLLDFTTYLQNMVVPIQDTVTSLTRLDNYWVLETPHGSIQAPKVILAIGAQPKTLNYNIPEIPLYDAFDNNKLAKHVVHDDCVAVFGGMHSAMLILKHLSECCIASAPCSVQRIINFYIEDYFFGSPGLEGDTAAWVENVLEKNPPANIIRVLNTPENREKFLCQCTKAIYAIGYESNKVLINGSMDVNFDENTGVIDENLYGIGIAFPPTAIFNGHKIAKNGLGAYLVYAKKLIPRWISNDKAHLTEEEHIEIPWI